MGDVDHAAAGNPRIGLALGGGSARGLAHIGIIQALAELGIEPTVITGTSSGALVAGVYATDHLNVLEEWARGLSTRDIIRYMDINLVVRGGFADGRRLIEFFREKTGDVAIESLRIPFGAVATDLRSGQEIWLRNGPLWDAVRASMALPGILTPVQLGERWVLDGGLVNPVPVSLCRAMEADRVIAVNLTGALMGRQLAAEPAQEEMEIRLLGKISAGFKERATAFLSQIVRPSARPPGLFDVLTRSVHIMQDRITRSRMAGDPPDIVLTPRLGDIGLLEFDRAGEAIDEGRECVRRMRPVLEDTLGRFCATQ